MFLLHNHWLAVHKVGWNACVTDGLRGREGHKNRLSSLPLVGINTLFAGIEMGIKGEGGQKCACGRQNAGLVMCSSRVRA